MRSSAGSGGTVGRLHCCGGSTGVGEGGGRGGDVPSYGLQHAAAVPKLMFL
jgi:hypothetical protein